MTSALVCGGGGFIGAHLVKRLKSEGFWVRAVDLNYPGFSPTVADDFIIADLRDFQSCREAVDRPFDEIYQLAADMGGAGYIFTGKHDADVMHNSATINLNMLEACRRRASGAVSKRVYPGTATARHTTFLPIRNAPRDRRPGIRHPARLPFRRVHRPAPPALCVWPDPTWSEPPLSTVEEDLTSPGAA